MYLSPDFTAFVLSAYSKERRAFGKPIVSFQGVGFKIADMGMKTQAARLLTYNAAGRPVLISSSFITFAYKASGRFFLNAPRFLPIGVRTASIITGSFKWLILCNVLLSALPESVPGVTLNRMCGSSQQAVHFAAQSVAAGDSEYIIAGGVESMTLISVPGA